MLFLRIRRWLTTYARVVPLAISATSTLIRSRRRGIFLDCGSNVGQGFTFFRRFYRSRFFDFALFEPNPHCFNILAGRVSSAQLTSTTLHNVAIGAREGETLFYGIAESEGGQLSQGGSILEQHNSLYYHPNSEAAISVMTIRFADFVTQQAANYPVIVAKLDIEGAEYDVLEDLLDSGVARLIHTLYVEFHSEYMSEPEHSLFRAREESILQRLRACGCRIALWR